ELGPSIIAPSPGPIWRDPQPILTWYQKWTSGETAPKELLIYVSMWGSTEKLVQAARDALRTAGVVVAVPDLAHADLGALCADLVDSRALIFGAPTVLGGLHPLAAFVLDLIRALHPPLRAALFLGSYGWAGGAARQFQEILTSLSAEPLGIVDVPGHPGPEELRQVQKMLQKLTAKVLA
ncbi:MAG: flavodoxin domain-containing protein, partial [Candidatus Bipolaricaulaceae bacterium]